jgi:hypothetical protein
MNTAKMSEWIKYPRRRFLSVAAMSFAAAELGTIGSANVQSDKPQAGLPKIKPGTITSFSPLKQLDAGVLPLTPKAELQWWYQFYFATERGRAGYEKYRRDFAKLIWQLASPKWNFDDATFDRSAASFDNPDHMAGDKPLTCGCAEAVLEW